VQPNTQIAGIAVAIWGRASLVFSKPALGIPQNKGARAGWRGGYQINELK